MRDPALVNSAGRWRSLAVRTGEAWQCEYGLLCAQKEYSLTESCLWNLKVYY